MGDIAKGVRPTHNALIRVNRRRRVLMPNREGVLEVLEAAPDGAHLKPVDSSQDKPKAKKQSKRKVARAGDKFDASVLKATDLVAFNTKAEEFFVHWLGEKIRSTGYKGVELGWIFPNAAFELHVSIETAKRYLAKHTADRAEFHSDGKIVTFREDGEE
jgi:hypothetical protein